MGIFERLGWSVGVTLKHYRCHHVIPKCTQTMTIYDTAELRHHHLNQHSVMPDDRVLHGMQRLTSALQGAQSSESDGQMTAIQEIQDALNNRGVEMTFTNQEPEQSQALPSTKDKWDNHQSPRVQPPASSSKGAYPHLGSSATVSKGTNRTQQSASSRANTLLHIAY